MTCLQLDAGQDADIRRAATFMVERYGRTAVARAARRACVLLLAGYSGAASIWTRIAALAEQLVGPASQPEAAPARETATNVIPFRIRSPYPSGRVRPNAPSSAGRRVAVGRLIPSLSPSVGTSRSPSPLRS